MRGNLTSKYIDDASDKVFDQITQLPEVKKAKTILVYSDFANEIKTGKLTGWLLFHGAKVALPTIHGGKMYAIDIKGSHLELCDFGMTQPKYNEGAVIKPDKIDVIIVPGLAFDRQLNRVGFGKGYYDIFLKDAGKAKKIGICYDFQVLDTIPAEEQDVPMDMVISQDEIIS